ncbi:hypothetical protein llap_9283 [Limosa lapponica baueri]|uniref:Uncharacterized protein n=1 Tax=Limosa lapponica baueri TaxID=1758121 RepID=A0A2I0U308_LIMLA|nr:hypothetical protein llap_9283 [Limosa lapponica baueri]
MSSQCELPGAMKPPLKPEHGLEQQITESQIDIARKFAIKLETELDPRLSEVEERLIKQRAEITEDEKMRRGTRFWLCPDVLVLAACGFLSRAETGTQTGQPKSVEQRRQRKAKEEDKKMRASEGNDTRSFRAHKQHQVCKSGHVDKVLTAVLKLETQHRQLCSSNSNVQVSLILFSNTNDQFSVFQASLPRRTSENAILGQLEKEPSVLPRVRAVQEMLGDTAVPESIFKNVVTSTLPLKDYGKWYQNNNTWINIGFYCLYPTNVTQKEMAHAQLAKLLSTHSSEFDVTVMQKTGVEQQKMASDNYEGFVDSMGKMGKKDYTLTV